MGRPELLVGNFLDLSVISSEDFECLKELFLFEAAVVAEAFDFIVACVTKIKEVILWNSVEIICSNFYAEAAARILLWTESFPVINGDNFDDFIFLITDYINDAILDKVNVLVSRRFSQLFSCLVAEEII